jgi:hypothetical protein
MLVIRWQERIRIKAESLKYWSDFYLFRSIYKLIGSKSIISLLKAYIIHNYTLYKRTPSFLRTVGPFLGTFIKLPQATISFVMSVRLSTHPSTMNNSTPTEEIFMKFYTWVFFENLSIKFKFHYNLTRIRGTLHEDQYTFWIISHSVVLRIRNV